MYDDNNQPKTVAYQALSSLLPNEFQKEHRRCLASEARAQLELAALTARTVAAEARAMAATEGLAATREEAQRGRQELVSLCAQMRQVR